MSAGTLPARRGLHIPRADVGLQDVQPVGERANVDLGLLAGERGEPRGLGPGGACLGEAVGLHTAPLGGLKRCPGRQDGRDGHEDGRGQLHVVGEDFGEDRQALSGVSVRIGG